MSWHDAFPYLLIAPLTAGTGWLTNMLAVKMMFYPIEFVGFGRILGWQGIIPRLRLRLTRNLIDQSVSKICTPKELIHVLNESHCLEYVQKLITPHFNDWIDDVLDEEDIQAWRYAPGLVKEMVFQQVQKKLPDIAQSILDEIAERADQLVDFNAVAQKQVQDHPEILNELFLRCAGSELQFVIRSGLIFGIPLGCIQALCWYFFPHILVLPLFGVVVGAGTNWLALKLIAHPAEPVKIGAFKVQGLYLRRQKAVSHEFAQVFIANLMNPKGLVDHLWSGQGSAEVHRIVHRHVRRSLDKNLLGKLAAQLAVTPRGFEKIRKKSVEYTAYRIIESIDTPATNKQLAEPVIRLISQRMANLTPREFQQLLLPAFEQDQLMVVLLGGVLGGAVGFAQLVWLFGV